MANEGIEPRPVPSLAAEPQVTDEDRNRYGHLLDRAAERGLIDPADYEVRLRDLAAATTLEELNRIVTELPAFSAIRSTPAPSSTRGGWGMRSGRYGSGRSNRRSSPWLLLVVVMAVIVVSLVVLAVLTAHLARTHNTGLPPSATRVAGAVSVPRP